MKPMATTADSVRYHPAFIVGCRRQSATAHSFWIFQRFAYGLVEDIDDFGGVPLGAEMRRTDGLESGTGVSAIAGCRARPGQRWREVTAERLAAVPPRHLLQRAGQIVEDHLHLVGNSGPGIEATRPAIGHMRRFSTLVQALTPSADMVHRCALPEEANETLPGWPCSSR